MVGYFIKDFALPREETLRGEIYGFIRLYNVTVGGPEASPEYVFSTTYPTSDIKNSLTAIFEKLEGRREQGTFILVGGFGCGKSHILLLVYHIFSYPDIATEWLKKIGLDVKVPKKVKVVLMPLMNMNISYLWEPFLRELGKEELLEKVGSYPTPSLIKEAIGDQTVIVIMDELEAWYGALGNEVTRNRNRNFLQNLTEVSKERDSKLLFFASLYGKEQDLMGTISRVKPYLIDLTLSADRPKIVLFRLFKQIYREKVGPIINGYISSYKRGELELGDINEYRKQMYEFYPIHPELFKVLFERYSSSKNYQNTRGVLNLLASIIAKGYEKKDIILTSDVDAEEAELLQLDRELVEKCVADIKRNPKGFGREILNTVLLYSLGEIKERGASEQDIILGILRPDQNINDIYASLSDLKVKAWHLWKVNDRYLIKPEENVLVVIQSEAERMVNEGKIEGALEKIKQLLKRDKSFYIYPEEEIPEEKDVRVIVSLKKLDEQSINEFYKGRKYRNTLTLIVPKTKDDLKKDTDLLTIAQRVALAEEKLKEVSQEKRGTIIELLDRDKKELQARINEIYGDWLKPIIIEKGKVGFRPTSCSLSEVKAKVKASYDLESVKHEIAEALEGKEQGLKVEDLMEDFYTILGKPILMTTSVFEDASIALCKEGKIVVIRGSKVYDEKEPPTKIDETMILKFKKYHKEEPEIIEKEAKPKVRHKEMELIEEEKVKGEKAKAIVIETGLHSIETREYRTPFMLAQELERKLIEGDIVKSAEITVKAEIKGHEEIIDLIDKLKVKDAEVKGDFNLTLTLKDYSRSEIIALLDRFPTLKEGSLKANLKVKRVEESGHSS